MGILCRIFGHKRLRYRCLKLGVHHVQAEYYASNAVEHCLTLLVPSKRCGAQFSIGMAYVPKRFELKREK